MTDSLHDSAPAGHGAAGAGLIKPGYDPRLTNEDLAPLKKQTWTSYNIFAFWMSDVHSVGGYITAGSLFALGLASWQVLIALLVGITHRLLPVQPGGQAQPGHRRALPGGLPGLLRRARRQHPGHHPRPDRGGLVRHPDLPGLGRWSSCWRSSCGPAWRPTPTSSSTASPGCRCWAGSRFMLMWIAAGARVLARHGVDPQVHRLLRPRRLRRDVRAVRLPGVEAGWANIDLNLAEVSITEAGPSLPVMLAAIALVVSLLLRADAELRRLRPLRQELRGGEEGQLPRPAGQLPGLLAARGRSPRPRRGRCSAS